MGTLLPGLLPYVWAWGSRRGTSRARRHLPPGIPNLCTQVRLSDFPNTIFPSSLNSEMSQNLPDKITASLLSATSATMLYVDVDEDTRCLKKRERNTLLSPKSSTAFPKQEPMYRMTLIFADLPCGAELTFLLLGLSEPRIYSEK